MAEFWAFLGLVVSTAGDVLAGRADAAVLADLDHRWGVAIAIACVAALSGMLGHAGLLAINRVGGFDLAVTWLLASVQLLVTLMFEALVLWVWLRVIVGAHMDLGVALRVVLLASAPLWFSFVGIAPYFGPLIGRVLWGWVLFALWGLLDVLVPQMPAWQGLLVILTTWISARVIADLLDPAVQWVRRGIWHSVMRRPLRSSATELLAAGTARTIARDHAPPGPQTPGGGRR